MITDEASSSSLAVSDAVIWREYLETVVRERDEWKLFYRAARAAAP